MCSRLAATRSSLVNLRLAEALGSACESALNGWADLPVDAQSWLIGAMRYFAQSADAEPDFASAIGFEDDAEILNACLCFAGLKELCVTPEDFDDV